MRNFLFTVVALGALIFSACASDRPASAESRIPAATTSKNTLNRTLDLSGLPERFDAYDETISRLKKEIALLEEQSANLKQRLDHLEQQQSR